jgi:hypothetical protein
MVRTAKRSDAALTLQDGRSSVTAYIRKGPQNAIGATHDGARLTCDVDGQVTAWLGYLGRVPDRLPGVPKDLFFLDCEEFCFRVPARRDREGRRKRLAHFAYLGSSMVLYLFTVTLFTTWVLPFGQRMVT